MSRTFGFKVALCKQKPHEPRSDPIFGGSRGVTFRSSWARFTCRLRARDAGIWKNNEPGGMANLDSLPSEIILSITRCMLFFRHLYGYPLIEAVVLNPLEIVTLQHVCKRLLTLARDNTLWKEQCFFNSSFLESLRRRRELIATDSVQEPRFRDLARALANGNGLAESRLLKAREEARDFKAQSQERIRISANWDPSYPTEKVRWYDEYIARNAPISTSWLQQPRNRESAEHEYLEVRGLGLYKPPGEADSTFAVAPLDDGSVCIWDLTGRKGRKGSIVARSKSRILSVDEHPQNGLSKRSKMISTGVTECVSVDNVRGKAYVAVQSGMVSPPCYIACACAL